MFDDIDKRRAANAITQKALCARAGVHPTTYSALKNDRSGGQIGTLQKLSSALDRLIAEKTGAAA